MKGIIVFNGMNDAIFIASDEEFKVHVNQLGKSNGLLEPDASDTQTIDPNVAVQLFSPLAASQRFMVAQLNNPYSSVLCENGFLFVFRQFGDQLHIAINGDKTESEEFLNRKLAVFQRLIGVLYGPVSEEIKPEHSQERKHRQKFLRRLLRTWSQSYHEEQSFLVEAVERLNVNQMVNEKCIECLEEVMDKVYKAGEKNVQHALLLVNSKLLALYSSRNAVELQPGDILAMILLVRNLLPSEERLEDLFSYSYREPAGSESEETSSPVTAKVYVPKRERYESAAEGDDEESEEEDIEYYSPRTTPVKGKPEQSDSSNSDELSQRENSAQHVDPGSSPGRSADEAYSTSPYPKVSMQGSDDFFYTPRETTVIEDHDEVHAVHQVTASNDYDVKEKEGTSSPTSPSSRSSPLDTGDYQRIPVFLITASCQHSPHILHCIRLFPGMVLVVVSQSHRSGQSSSICQTLNLLKEVLVGTNSSIIKDHGSEVFDMLETKITKVLGMMKKGSLDKLKKDIKQRWADSLKNGLQMYLNERAKDEMSPGLEAVLSSLHSRMNELFRLLYLSPAQQNGPVQQSIRTSQEHIVHQLTDFKDYLAVKAQRNVTMTAYLEDFPGLVHFIYIDRMSNQITAPSINISNEEQASKPDATQWLKDKVWQMTAWIQGKLSQGYTTLTVRDGDFHFGYFIWFEDSAGHPLTIQQPFKTDTVVCQPGVLAGNFYTQMIRTCFPNGILGGIHCYELFTVHVGLVSTQYIVSHCRKLASKLWETSGEAFTPIRLL